MEVSSSAYYAWKRRPGELITAHQLHLYRRCKALFKASRGSLGSRQLMKKLRKEGFHVGRYKVRKLMTRLNLVVKQRIAYKVTTKQKHNSVVADNLLDQQFNPEKPNQVWAGDVTYLRTAEGWMYLAMVMDLHSRRVIGWAVNKRMTVNLVVSALKMAINLRGRHKGLMFHSDRGSQYTSKIFQRLLAKNGITSSMSHKGACLDNAVVERFFGSLKHEWLLNIHHLTRDGMKKDVEAYIKYYNRDRLHTSIGDLSPIEFENSTIKLCGKG